MSKYRSGQKASASGQYEIVGPRGGRTGRERTIVKGEPLPPTPNRGQGFRPSDLTKSKSGTGSR